MSMDLYKLINTGRIIVLIYGWLNGTMEQALQAYEGFGSDLCLLLCYDNLLYCQCCQTAPLSVIHRAKDD